MTYVLPRQMSRARAKMLDRLRMLTRQVRAPMLLLRQQRSPVPLAAAVAMLTGAPPKRMIAAGKQETWEERLLMLHGRFSITC